MKSICFDEVLQNAIIELRKTETRRIMNPQPNDYRKNPRGHYILPDENRADLIYQFHVIRPRYKVGEIIYIKEPYIDDIDPDRVFYKYDPADIQALQDLGYREYIDKPGFWRSKQSMPASQARLFLRITACHAERLQSVTEEAAKREGVQLHPSITDAYVHYAPRLHFTAEQLREGAPYCRSARASFQTLMELFEGPKIWDRNPYVWVYGFELVPELTKAERRFYKLPQHERQ